MIVRRTMLRFDVGLFDKKQGPAYLLHSAAAETRAADGPQPFPLGALRGEKVLKFVPLIVQREGL